jgi:3-phenylpropionate/trans-cinnamate dioxygenase ferredoxin reductase subunit
LTNRVVVVGAGHAAGQLATSLAQHPYDGPITLIGNEPYLPYQRPPLSKKFLAGEVDVERLFVRPESFYADAGIDLRLDTHVDSLDREAKRLHTSGGDVIDYDKLVLALGSRVRRLRVDGTDLEGVHYLRNIADVSAIRDDFAKATRVIVIGAGYIGLEVAAVARQAGLDVTVLEIADRVMSRVVSPEISDFYQIEHTNQGVKLRLSTGVKSINGKKRVKSVTTSNGEEIPADVVIVGVGIVPNTELATAADLEVDDGIIVDDRCVTSDPDIYAIGDCTMHPNAIFDRNMRLESVHNAVEQAKIAAANLCGIEERYCDVPWFWSDQYDLKLQIAGLSDGYDDVIIRGNPAERSFSCIYLRDNRIIAVDAINAPRDFVHSKQLIACQAAVDASRVADADVELKSLAV